MPPYTQANQPIEVVTPLGTDTLLITSFQGEEGISRLFHFRIDMVAEVKKEIAFNLILGQKVTIRLNQPVLPHKPRYFSGICVRFSQGEADTDFCTYQMEMAPAFWLWTKVAQTRTFQQQSVPDILKVVLQGLEVTYQLTGTYEPRNYCVQYRETDFNFACRLMEEEGIFYFFTHAADGHKMVVADSSSSHPAMPLASTLTFEKRLQSGWAEDRILAWQRQQELVTGKFTLRDHSLEMTGKDLEASATVPDAVAAGKAKHSLKAGKADSREIYDFPGDYAVRFDGVDPGGGERPADLKKILTDNTRTVGLRLQQEAVLGVVIHGSGNCRNLVSGHKFTLQKHANADGDYLLTTVQHQIVGAIDYRASSSQFQYVNSFTAIPFGVPFRPQRATPKPFVQGTQTATVVGPAGQEIFTDKYGRVKVQFNWDRAGKKDAKSSCWVRVSQLWAGKRWGASFWPRIGQEVVVAFLEGNPDWPIIVGSVYNDQQMPPYLGDGPDAKHPKDNKISGIKSNSTPDGKGFNEWRFDDTKDKEQIFIHAQRNLDITVNHDAFERVFLNSHSIVGTEKDGKKGDRYEMVFQDKHTDIKRNQIEQIEGNLQLTIGKGQAQSGGNLDLVVEKNVTEAIGQDVQTSIVGNRVEKVAKDQSLTVTGNVFESVGAKVNVEIATDRNEKVGGSQTLDIATNLFVKVGKDHALEAGANVHIKGATNVVIEAGTKLTLKVGGSFVVIESAGVSIVGGTVKINSGGSPGSGGGATPVAPEAPKTPANATQAQPTKPTIADDSKSGAKSASS